MVEIINSIYNNLIGIILKDVDNSYHEILKTNYLKYLNDKYYEKYKDYEDTSKILGKLINFEMAKWEDKPGNTKLTYLIDDPALNKLSEISSCASQYANDRKEIGVLLDEGVAEELIKEMENNLELVADFNKSLSSWYFSEALVELNFACGKTENTSLRMGH